MKRCSGASLPVVRMNCLEPLHYPWCSFYWFIGVVRWSAFSWRTVNESLGVATTSLLVFPATGPWWRAFIWRDVNEPYADLHGGPSSGQCCDDGTSVGIVASGVFWSVQHRTSKTPTPGISEFPGSKSWKLRSSSLKNSKT